MGFFSRKESASHRRPVGRTRPSVSSEAQATELRVKARRRLAGAVAIVLCAIIVLPMLLDSEPVKVPANIEVTIPSRNAPFNPDLTPPLVQADGSAMTISPGQDLSAQPIESSIAKPVDLGPADANKPPAVAAPPVEPAANVAIKPAETESKPVASVAPRTDESARARAILEGRLVPSAEARVAQASPTIKENLVVQIASYSAQVDAQSRSETLKTQGITNAYVEPVTVNGRQVFRLRVGPFSSREAAQAGQARLRTLGYANGFITTQ
jgi:DedD protein